MTLWIYGGLLAIFAVPFQKGKIIDYGESLSNYRKASSGGK